MTVVERRAIWKIISDAVHEAFPVLKGDMRPGIAQPVKWAFLWADGEAYVISNMSRTADWLEGMVQRLREVDHEFAREFEEKFRVNHPIGGHDDTYPD